MVTELLGGQLIIETGLFLPMGDEVGDGSSPIEVLEPGSSKVSRDLLAMNGGNHRLIVVLADFGPQFATVLGGLVLLDDLAALSSLEDFFKHVVDPIGLHLVNVGMGDNVRRINDMLEALGRNGGFKMFSVTTPLGVFLELLEFGLAGLEDSLPIRQKLIMLLVGIRLQSNLPGNHSCIGVIFRNAE